MPEEKQILELKYKSKALSDLTPDELLKQAINLLIKIHVITGWEIPQKEFMDILLDQFVKKCLESYAKINPDEIEYAFRNKPEGVKEWGKAMNLSLLDEVILPYMSKRYDISIVHEKPKVIEYKPDIEQIEKEYHEAIKRDPVTAAKYGMK